MQEFTEKGITVRVYEAAAPSNTYIYLPVFEEDGEEIQKEMDRLGCPPAHLITFSLPDWMGDLSPWPHEAIFKKAEPFAGNADATLEFLQEDVIPRVEKEPAEIRILAGYSMGGLFALYAPHKTDLFESVLSASGALWYTGFKKYVEETPFQRTPVSVYLSLGDKESKTRNPYFQRNQGVTEELAEWYQDQGIRSTFCLEEGSHNTDPVPRLCKGIQWILETDR